jgi:2-oxoisovalerate dehydrogenase E2 component (dihydrolipoyl transacylase)
MAPVGSVIVVLEVEGAGNARRPSCVPRPDARARLPQSTPHAHRRWRRSPPEPAAGGNYVFKLPDVGEGTAEAEIVAWHVKVGDAVAEDQPDRARS